MSNNLVSGTLFNCHKCAWLSHLVLTFRTFLENDYATTVTTVLFTRNCFESWLYLLLPFYYRYIYLYIYIDFGLNWLKN